MKTAPTSFSPSRRNFLLGDIANSRAVVRPPWALEEGSFQQSCTRCNACASACEEAIIRFDLGGYPFLDFSLGGCTFCEKCVESCEPGALSKNVMPSPWVFQIEIKEDCLAKRYVVCRTCGERCDVGAIRFSPTLGGVSLPKLDTAVCTGCGFCIADCPSQAIQIHPVFAEAV